MEFEECMKQVVFAWWVTFGNFNLYINQGTIQRRCRGINDWEELNECFRVRFKELIDEVCKSLCSEY